MSSFDETLRRRLILAVNRVRLETAATRVHVAAARLGWHLERRYRPDQPRAPRGAPIGGQWIDAGGGSTSVASEMTMFGRLKTQYRYAGTLTCIYDFGGQAWILTYPKDGGVGCYAIVHQDTALRLGTRLNDN